jgi:cyanophycin synthetase
MDRASLQRAGPTHASSPASPDPAVQVKRLQALPGYLPGTTVPCATYAVAIPGDGLDRSVLDSADAEFAAALPGYTEALAAAPGDWPAVARVGAAAQAVLLAGGWPVPAELGIHRIDGKPPQITLPAPMPPALMDSVVQWAAAVLCDLAGGAGFQTSRRRLDRLLDVLSRDAPKGMNTSRFLLAARALGIPQRRLWGNVYQFGWGSAARRLDSSFTDATPQMATRLARSKIATAHVLREAGLPVPDHAPAESEDRAVRIAERLGYPVVVKPADQDGGRGVSADLRTEAAVRKAWRVAREASPSVLVEKHFHGNDHRLQVFGGAVFWAVHRVPGGVLGDGRRTVRALLDEVNADPRRGPRGSNALLKHIDLDDEALELLAEQSIGVDSIPAAGQFVRMRRAANVASGGHPVPVLEQAHPDNLALGARAARILGLDLAGIDLLIPDIRVSWLESGAAICEVNAQPQLSPRLPELLLKSMLPRGGRIPAVVVAGACPAQRWAELAMALRPFGRVGLAAPAEVSIEGTCVLPRPRDAFQAGWSLLADPGVDAVLLHVSGPEALARGMPFDRFDVLVAGDAPRPLLAYLQRMCANPMIPVAAGPAEPSRILSDTWK